MAFNQKRIASSDRPLRLAAIPWRRKSWATEKSSGCSVIVAWLSERAARAAQPCDSIRRSFWRCRPPDMSPEAKVTPKTTNPSAPLQREGWEADASIWGSGGIEVQGSWRAKIAPLRMPACRLSKLRASTCQDQGLIRRPRAVPDERSARVIRGRPFHHVVEDRRDALFDCGLHRDRPAPLSLGFAGPLVG